MVALCCQISLADLKQFCFLVNLDILGQDCKCYASHYVFRLHHHNNFMVVASLSLSISEMCYFGVSGIVSKNVLLAVVIDCV